MTFFGIWENYSNPENFLHEKTEPDVIPKSGPESEII